MESLDIGLITALIAGVLSFASPCVLPIVPGYLSFITGLSLQDLTEHESRKRILHKAAINSVVFVLGFSFVFILLGASANAIGNFLRENFNIIGKIAGAVIVILGLHMVGLIKIPFLMYEKRIHSQKKSSNAISSLIAGFFFAFGWSPCIGLILAGILALAAVQQTALKGMILLSFYSLGLGIPFVLSAIFLNHFFTTFSKIKHHLHKVETTGGVILIAIGFLIFTGNLAVISQRLDFMNPEYLLQSGSSPSQNPQIGVNQKSTLINSTTNKIDNKSSIVNDSLSSKADYGKYNFTLTTIDGKTVHLSDYTGKVVLVNIWAPWCGPCRLETPGFVSLYDEYKDKGFDVIGIAVQTKESDVKEFIKGYNIQWQIGINDDIARAYGTYGLPDNYLFASDGKLIKHFVGYTKEETLKSVLKDILKGQK
ncbi:cytochrome c biogenesis protein CcdA [Melioribacteraceae bacterium 4301-Me]|uniref:redoxin family protein n=1 Tax=Pyranulibacter aquaticus TaxID=3163344 RepID=UPI00359BF0E7